MCILRSESRKGGKGKYVVRLNKENRYLMNGYNYGMSINEKINLTINSHITKNCEKLFIEDIKKVEVKERSKLQDAKYIILFLSIRLKPEPILDYRNKNEIYITVSPKIKSYTIFRSEENYNKYIEEELNDNDLYLSCNVVNGKIII